MNVISAESLKPLLSVGYEYAFLDVREHGQYGEGHPFFSVPFPYSRLETLAKNLLPRKSVHLFLMDDGDGVAEKAASVFESLGYKNCSVLEGGAPAWEKAGYTLYKGVNVPSKTYGELLEHIADTPRLTADELHALLQRDPSVVVLDGRNPAEYRKMSLPGATCCPNAELGYRIRTLVPDESTTVVINCAGRTRSILGVEGLRVLDIQNPIFALENGTQGWTLAGYELDRGVEPQTLPVPDEALLDATTRQADALIEAAQIDLVTPETVQAWLDEEVQTTYILDVRSRTEFDAAHWPGARHAPGGQLVQATDQYVAVRNARLVLNDDNNLRAATTAIRLQDMGHDVYLLDVDARTGQAKSAADTSNPTEFPSADSMAGTTILDASPGMDYRDGHISNARWVTRARIDGIDLSQDEALLVTGQDPVLVQGVVAELKTLGFNNIQSCAGTPDSWVAAGFDIVATPDSPTDDACIDYLFFVHDRHDNNLEASRRYLEWEVGLVDQMDAQERSALNPRAQFGQE